jgi:hypothetical protein
VWAALTAEKFLSHGAELGKVCRLQCGHSPEAVRNPPSHRAAHPCDPSTERLRQEDCEFQGILGCMERSCLKTNKRSPREWLFICTGFTPQDFKTKHLGFNF